MRKKIKIFGKVLSILVLLYFFVAACFYVFQDQVIFQEEKLANDYAFTFDQKFEEHFIATEDGVQLNALVFRAQQPSKGLILYFHGNGDNLARWGQYAIDFTKLGYDILMADYRGYGKSTGKPNEEDFYEDAQTILRWSQSNIKHERLIIYGRSLGSAVASNLATTANPSLVILEAPFDEISGVLNIFPVRYNFPNKKFITSIKCRMVIIHGTDDWVVPLSSSARLKPLLKENDRFVVIKGASHNDLREFEEYHSTLKEVLN